VAPRRKLDWDAARELRSDGLSYAEIARRFEVSEDAVRYACDEQARASSRRAAIETMRRKRESGAYRHHDLSVCPRCHGVKSRRGRLCQNCRDALRAQPEAA
jgi:hypothetical protein